MLDFLPPSSPFEAPSRIYAFRDSPVVFLARALHHCLLSLRPNPTAQAPAIRVVCISDTHTHRKRIPDGDILIHAGDLTNAGTVAEIQGELDWVRSQHHAYKIVIAGNHDTYLDPCSRETLKESDRAGQLDWGDIEYLQHRSVKLIFPNRGNRELTIYGAPQIPACGGSEFAFQYHRDQDMWTETISLHTDILVTHTPPQWHLDLPVGLGCKWLLNEIWRVRPRLLHVFGHVHAGHGKEVAWWDEDQAAYERICARDRGLVTSMLNPRMWIDIALIILFGVIGVVRHGIWRADVRGCILVNASLMSQKTSKLGNEPQVILI